MTDAAGGDHATGLRRHDNLLAVTDPAGNRTQYIYDIADRLIRVTDPAGNATAYDLRRRRATSSPRPTPSATSTTFAYDGLGRMVAVDRRPGRARRPWPTTAYGNLVSADRPARPQDDISPTIALNRLISVTDPLGKATALCLRPRGEPDLDHRPAGNMTQYAYDALTPVHKVTDATRAGSPRPMPTTPSATSRRAPTRSAGRRRSPTTPWATATVTDPLGNVTTSAYDAARNVTARTDPLGHATRTVYDALNRPSQLTDAGGGIVTNPYDAARQPRLHDRPAGADHAVRLRRR